jgi:hypothetical protein
MGTGLVWLRIGTGGRALVNSVLNLIVKLVKKERKNQLKAIIFLCIVDFGTEQTLA